MLLPVAVSREISPLEQRLHRRWESACVHAATNLGRPSPALCRARWRVANKSFAGDASPIDTPRHRPANACRIRVIPMTSLCSAPLESRAREIPDRTHHKVVALVTPDENTLSRQTGSRICPDRSRARLENVPLPDLWLFSIGIKPPLFRWAVSKGGGAGPTSSTAPRRTQTPTS